jgi:copper oxidase (laccase) domain-containing protein
MINYRKIHYLKPSVGYFPEMREHVNHGFSWGKEAGNMAFNNGADSPDKSKKVKLNLQNFLNKLSMGKLENCLIMLPKHKDKILDIPTTTKYPEKPRGMTIKADALFTTRNDITLAVKPADCTTAIVYGQHQSEKSKDVIGLIHTGRRSVILPLIKNSIRNIKDKYGISPEHIQIGIVPHLFKENREMQHLKHIDISKWEGYFEKRNGCWYLDETGMALDQYKEAGILDKNLYHYKVNTFDAARKGECFSEKYHTRMKRKGIKVPNGNFIVAIRKKSE